ncbi:hypothetical protein B0J13DRAFT_615792 [Dactylonectria estremocensis]|uniref:Uncharacterized protein n=1 Tax=Dactylonectria estremocensis TaxID=1079267 RepID=A0A9P9FK52_9HYPO|nr:hypothetical protein B0J13DRAFT_615792 [Dactylonectria estremocensis]
MNEQTGQSWQGSRVSRTGTRSSPGLPQQRRYDESWVEVSSQPSSSSLSSIGDEIVTTGLRVGGPYNRRRRLQPPARSLSQQPTAVHTTAARASSPDDYEESESESEDDQVLTSSTENVHPSEEEMEMDSDADSDGDNVTALGRVSDQPTFRPQPNAFTHPPPHQAHQRNSSAPSNMPPPPHPHSGFTRPSFSQRSQTRPELGSPNFMTPSIREENDAALRASLTTLLSCAAAARGLPRSKEQVEAQRASNTGVSPSSQPMGLRLVPESELDAEHTRAQNARHATPSPPRKRGSPTRSASTDKSKHGPTTSSVPRATKKKKIAQSEETVISPTLLTWVVSAGVVVLVSVVGFGAGYVIGREVGKQEALAVSVGSVNETTSCGGEVIRSSSNGLRKLRWGAVGKSIVA